MAARAGALRPVQPWPRWRAGWISLDAALLAALMAAGLAVRLWALAASDELNSDEALPGLMALHIAAGRETPVFFYGQHYFGVPEAYAIALLFRLFGFHPWLIVVPAVAASTALVAITWALAAMMGGRLAGLLATLPVVCPPPILGKLFVNSGGFSLPFALHGAALLCFLRSYLLPPGSAGSLRWGMAFSLLAGLLCWIWQPALGLYAVLLLLLLARHRRLLWPHHLLCLVAPVGVGLAPPAIYNARHGWPTIAQLAQKYVTPAGEASSGLSEGPRAVGEFLMLAFGGGNEAEGGANPLQAALVALSFPLAIAILARLAHAAAGENPAPDPRRRLRAAGVLALAALVNALAAHRTVRHLVPVALLGYAFAGAALALLARHVRPRWLGHLLAGAVAAGAVVAPNLWLDHHTERIFRRFVARASAVEATAQGLAERGLTTGYGDYWSAYPVTYFAGERVILAPSAATVWGERVDRYPAYTHLVDAVDAPERLFLLLDDRCSPLPYLLPLEQANATYRLERIGQFYLLWDIRPPAGGEAATLAAWRATIRLRDIC